MESASKEGVILNNSSFVPQVKFKRCPIMTSLGVLGRKWTMLIIREIGFKKIDRFNRLAESIPGISPRVLAMRLKELKKEEFIESVTEKTSPKILRWRLTEKGKDTLPILMRFVAFGSKWYPEVVFEDKKRRTLKEVYPQAEIDRITVAYA